MSRAKSVIVRSAALAVVLSITPLPTNGQAVRVVVLDSSSTAPLSNALISLLDSTAGLIALHRTNDRGVGWLKVPEPGHFAIFVQKQGYPQLVSNWLTFGNTDTLEVTFRLTAVPQILSRVIVTAEQDSVGPLLPAGVNAKTLAGRIFTPSDIAAHSMGAANYIDVLESIGRSDFIVTRWEGKSCVTSTRLIRRPTMSRPLCARVYVNNMRADFEMALDLVSPESFDSAVWLRSSGAGLLYGSAQSGEDESVLLLYTKDWRRIQTKSGPKPPLWF